MAGEVKPPRHQRPLHTFVLNVRGETKSVQAHYFDFRDGALFWRDVDPETNNGQCRAPVAWFSAGCDWYIEEMPQLESDF